MTLEESGGKIADGRQEAVRMTGELPIDRQSNTADSATNAELPTAVTESKIQDQPTGKAALTSTGLPDQAESNAAPEGAAAKSFATTAPKKVAAQSNAVSPEAKPASAAKLAVAPKPSIAEKPASAAAVPFIPKPSLPVTMIGRPGANPVEESPHRVFPGELEGDFDEALSSLLPPPRRRLLSRLIYTVMRRWSSHYRKQLPETTARTVAFDGFRTSLYEEKLERDRRYGTVYTVSEERDGFITRLEMPRRLPNSALKNTWNLPDEMPDYDYMLALDDNVLSIRAGVQGEAYRRLSYVSPSFPSDYLTRIEFPTEVAGFKHRLRNKLLEIIVYKRSPNDLRTAA
ncbi:MAG: hypothetical protein JO166_14875 [Deltaproteobacteria bacterium]|nr:hypothetical protein [Deltaproteobacteria bacterium]